MCNTQLKSIDSKLFLSAYRSSGSSYDSDDRGSDRDSGSLRGIHAVRLVLSCPPSTQTEDGEGTVRVCTHVHGCVDGVHYLDYV